MAVINPRITELGLQAAFNAQSTGIDVEITHLAFGSGAYDPDGDESALLSEVKRVAIGAGARLGPKQIRIAAIWMSDTEEASINEIGFYAGDVLFAVASRASGGPYLYKTAGSNLIFSYDWFLSAVSPDLITVVVDPDAQALLVHLADQNAHPQYLTIAEYEQRDHKNSVRVATTANLASLSGTPTIDGIATSAGDRVLVKNQSQSQYNGIYVVSSGAWSRASDANASAKVTSGLIVSVEQGTVNADSMWMLVTDGAITLGSTPLIFGVISGPVGITPGTYHRVTVDGRGRVTAGDNPVIPVTEGGTGATTAPQARENLGITAALATKQDVLGFTPVQQGGGAGQSSSKIYIGWSAEGLRLQIDLTDFAFTWPISVGGNAESATKLKTARTINDVPFDGSENISITTAPTAPAGSNSTLIANTAFVQAAIAALVNSSPAALDTLSELAASLGNDPNFATTVLNALAGKVNRDSITDAGFAGGDTNYPYFRAAVDGVVHYLQKALGFTPVQQGGGAGQSSSKIYIGFDGADLRAQVDLTDFGQLWSDHNGPQKIGAMAVGSVGSYALCIVGGGAVDVAVTAGTLVAGSNLRYAAASGGFSGTPSGTWRVMGHLYDANLNDTNSVTLCLRVS